MVIIYLIVRTRYLPGSNFENYVQTISITLIKNHQTIQASADFADATFAIDYYVPNAARSSQYIRRVHAHPPEAGGRLCGPIIGGNVSLS